MDLSAPANSAPEVVIPSPSTKYVQVVFDMGSNLVGGTVCKDVSASSQYFTDLPIQVD